MLRSRCTFATRLGVPQTYQTWYRDIESEGTTQARVKDRTRLGRNVMLRICGIFLSIWISGTSLLSGWWFGTFFIFPYIGNIPPNWLIFLRWVETTNQFYCGKTWQTSNIHSPWSGWDLEHLGAGHRATAYVACQSRNGWNLRYIYIPVISGVYTCVRLYIYI